MSVPGLFRLKTGSHLPEALVEMAIAHRWNSAICCGIGGISEVRLAYYDLQKREYLTFDVEGIVELVSLDGNLTKLDDKPFWHLHAIVADRTGCTHGGHLMSCKVALTVEFAVWPMEKMYTRTLEQSTGLRLLND
ncbi:MAG: DUF296 domain-containing protein [bacterium]|nr:DUF296 domain-containing protein [bacterium]